MPKTMEIEDHVNLNIFAMNPNNYTSAENIKQELSDTESQLMQAYIKASPNLLKNIDNPNDPNPQKTQQQLLNGLTLVLSASRKVSSGNSNLDAPLKPVWAPKESTWSKSLNGWYSNEPNADGKFELYEE